MIPKRALVAVVGTAFALVLLFSFKTPTDASAIGSLRASTVVRSVVGGSTGGTSGSTTTTSTKTIGGPAISTRYGDVQVSITVTNGRITSVVALQLPSFDSHSLRISQFVAPVLRQEVLAAQSASIDLVSGATFTSSAYVESLQGALDQLKR